MEQPRIGVYVCWCGSNIAKIVDVEAVAKDIATLPDVIISKDYKYMCSDPGQDMIISDIKKYKLNRIVVSACSPRIHELTFRKALENAGLNSYMFQMANIREHVSWVHIDKEFATRKAKSLITAAVNRVRFHEELAKRFVEINPATLVIGGGISGLTAALNIAEAGHQVYLIEKTEHLGGQAANIDLSFADLSPVRQIVIDKIKLAEKHKNIEIFCSTTIENIFGYIGNFNTTVKKDKKEHLLKFGNIIVATGLKNYNPGEIDEYGYKKFPDVITSYEFEKQLLSGKIETSSGNTPSDITIIHCVGSRNTKYHSYCSRTCCATALKYANQIRSALPESNIYELYADMRAFEKGCEELYTGTSRKGVMFLMFDQEKGLPVVKQNKEHHTSMRIEMHELLSGEDIAINTDMVILMTAVEAQDDARDVAHLAGISKCGNDFFIEKHPKLDPVATTTDGVFIVGTCQGPKGISDSISQSYAATARVLASIAKGSAEVEVITAETNEELCCGCQTCISVCPYTAITFDEEKNVSVVNEAICKGCGTCGSTCPTGAIRSRHFTDKQILSQIEGLMSNMPELV